ncbi:MAG TPA: hypothetical protein VNM69_00815 [Bacillus sp. (in: firmicutes)]|nr:hypothetical protein [Bacillus sp. (in: firmicutes)]
MRRNSILIGLAVIFVSWVGNYVYFSANQLSHPIVLKHYYEVPYEE